MYEGVSTTSILPQILAMLSGIFHYHRDYSPSAGTLDELGFDLALHADYWNAEPRLHGVDVVLLSCILSGRGEHHLDSEVFAEDGTSVTIVNYGQRHAIVTAEPMEVMNLFVDPSRRPLPRMPIGLSSILPQIVTLHPSLANRANRAIRIPIAPDDDVRALLEFLHREVHRKRPGYAELASHLFSSFLILLCRAAERNGVVRAAGDERLERVRLALDDRYSERLTLHELAHIAGMSRTYLCRTFRNYTGRTVFEYLLDRRLEAAMMGLRESDDKISTVASESGFSDLGYFNRKFRERFGMTPGEYRGATRTPTSGDSRAP